MMGYAIYEGCTGRGVGLSWRSAILFMVLANLPDIDFLPGFLVGEPNLYHRHYLSHSLGAAVIAGAAFAWFYHMRKMGQFWPNFTMFTLAYASHILLDYFGTDTAEPTGVPALWPFTDRAFVASTTIFMAVQKSNMSSSFFQSLFTIHNFWVAFLEFSIFLPMIILIKFFKYRERVAAWIMQKF